MMLFRRSREEKLAEQFLNFEREPAVLSEETVEVSFFVPCYNEGENVEKALDTIQTAVAERPRLTYEILVIDDGSTDQTDEVVKAYQKAHPERPIRLHRNPINLGLGASYVQGAALAKGYYYLIVNGDGDLPAEMILKLLDLRGEADIISPYVTNQRERPFHRQILSAAFTTLVGLFSGQRLRYYNGPVLHKRSNILEVRNVTRGFGYQAEILTHLLRKGRSIIEIPFASVYRHHQTDAFRLKNLLSVARSLLRIFLVRFQ